jgi:chaperonin cofactor prefoldin
MNLDWSVKLKTNKAFIKWIRKKKNKGQIEKKTNIWQIRIEGLNWKERKLFQKGQRLKKKLKEKGSK